MERLEKLLTKIILINKHIQFNEADPLLSESYQDYINDLKADYGLMLNELMQEIYVENFEDFEVEKIENYLTENGVYVESDDIPGVKAQLKLRSNPLRLELSNEDESVKHLVWETAAS